MVGTGTMGMGTGMAMGTGNLTCTCTHGTYLHTCQIYPYPCWSLVDASGDVQGGGVVICNKGLRCVSSPFCHQVAVLVLVGCVNMAVSGSDMLKWGSVES